METTLNLILLALVLILAAILTPDEKRAEFRSSLFWTFVVGGIAYTVGPFVIGSAGLIYEGIGMKGVTVSFTVTFLLVMVILAWRHDRKENAKIRAGDAEAFNRRVKSLIQTGKYSREQAMAVVDRLKGEQ